LKKKSDSQVSETFKSGVFRALKVDEVSQIVRRKETE